MFRYNSYISVENHVMGVMSKPTFKKFFWLILTALFISFSIPGMGASTMFHLSIHLINN